MKLLILSILLSAALAKPSIDAQWAQFKASYNRHYSPEEEVKRFNIFAANLKEIEEHNARYEKGEVTYSKRMNKFGDMTIPEFRAFVNSTKPDIGKLPKGARHVMSQRPKAADVDWREKNAVTPVRDEGACDGASWAIAALGSLEGQLAINSGSLTQLSVQNLVDCSRDQGNGGCTGGFLESAYDYIQANGIESEQDYPYEASEGTCRFDASKSVTKISNYSFVRNEGELHDALDNVGPVAGVIYASEALRFYYGGIFFEDQCYTDEGSLNHGILIIGYGTEKLYDYWLAKNSWGEDWGQEGYYMPIRNYGNNCGIATHGLYPNL